jgi:NhaP-type Na+/H+ or K+/H+ antiporter
VIPSHLVRYARSALLQSAVAGINLWCDRIAPYDNRTYTTQRRARAYAQTLHTNDPMNLFLILGALLSSIAAVLHLGIIVKGASWYRFFGAGEKFARAAERGERWQDVVTFGIALVLFTWAAYALSGAGVIAQLPLLKYALVAITAIYLLRGLAIVPMMWFAREKITLFWVWSSLICQGFGIVHAIGLAHAWRSL